MIPPGALSRFLQGTFMRKTKTLTTTMFRKHLLLTNIGVSMTLCGTGDFMQQQYKILKSAEERIAYNKKRTINMSVTGCTVGFLCHHWYLWLDKFLPGRTALIVVKKVLIDQLICSPLAIITIFLTLSILERDSVAEFLVKMKEKSWRLYLADWVVWPFAQVINFAILPARYRVLYYNVIALGYDVYTSYVYNEIPTTTPSIQLEEY